VEIAIYNIIGERVKTVEDATRVSGKYSITWDGRNDAGQFVASGIYICRLQTEGIDKTIKMFLLI